MKKVMVLMAVCALMVALGAGIAGAQVWQNATISAAGSGVFGMNFVTLTSGTGAPTAYSNIQFYIYDSFPDSKNMLAAALTALAGSGNVSVYLGAVTNGSPCYGLIAMP